MAYYFSQRSKQALATVHQDLEAVLREAIKYYDFSIICGFRGEQEQNRAYNSGHSRLRWPQSRHNQQPSGAVDIIPWPSQWTDKAEFLYMAGLVMGIAGAMGIELEWGGRWISLDDRAHFQLKRP